MPTHHEQRPTYEDDDPNESEYWTKRDDKENLATRPPDGEHVNRPAIAVAECYVGGDVARLVGGVTRLGATAAEYDTGRGDFVEWATGVRSGSRSGGWIHIGHFRQDDGTPSHFMGPRLIELPPEFSRLILYAYAPTPAVTVAVATFILASESATALDDELRTDRYLRRDVRGSVTTFVGAAHRKGEEIDAERRRVQRVASKWLADNMPGTMSIDFGCAELPLLEVITTQLVAPFVEVEREKGTPFATYRSLLRINSDWDAWASLSTPLWRVGLPDSSGKGSQWAVVAGCVEDPVPVDDRGQENRRASAVRPHPTAYGELADTFGPFLVRWALRCLLMKYESRLAQVRDDLASEQPKRRRIRLPSRRKNLNVVANAQDVLSALAFDAAVVSQELLEFADNERAWRHEVPNFKACAEFRDDDYPSLGELLAEDIVDRCRWASSTEARLRDQITVMSNLEVSATNLRLQRQVFWLTIATVAIALVGIVVSAMTGG